MQRKYEKFDKVLIDIIRRNRPVIMSGIKVRIERRPDILVDVPKVKVYRLIDKRLAYLRKQGKIQYLRLPQGGPGWKTL